MENNSRQQCVIQFLIEKRHTVPVPFYTLHLTTILAYSTDIDYIQKY